ncbi:MAG TPA: single-stranded-DNA-specific exonuclease RecJ [Miltoncostaeaceae bacterium]|nr:single-stranded-DNA-specific exonuclease RecJ [Miltoncostaeaceae bacterium]
MVDPPLWRARRVEFDVVAALEQALDVPEPLAWALVRRGLADPDAARRFLEVTDPLREPDDTPGITAAARRLRQAIERGEATVVHGDYDCDGVTSTALLVGGLRARGARVSHVLPSRFTDGYGVNIRTVERVAQEGCRLLVCVDCGTSSVDALQRARDLGIDAIVLDHHLAGGARAPALIANPALGRPRPDLPAAAGVVYAALRALAAQPEDGLAGADPEADLDLVALATVADSVPLIGDNRTMVVRGLERLRRAPRPGIAALCAVGGVEARTATARTLGFTIAPCINAAGRLAHPDRALELLMAPDEQTALPIARELWELNRQRRETERGIVEEAIAMVEAEPPAIRNADAIVAAGDGWHEGVVGIVASRLVEYFERPAIVIAREGDRAKGSGRSPAGVDLHALVGAASEPLARWGGHSGAVGLELSAQRIGHFRELLLAAAADARPQIARARVRSVDAVVGCPDLTLANAEALEVLAPFGRGNPAVRLAVPAARIDGARTVGGGAHLELRLTQGGAHARSIGFQLGKRAPGLDMTARHDAVVALEVERWQGVVGPRVNLRALRALSVDDVSWAQAATLETAGRARLSAALIDASSVERIEPTDGAPRAPRGVRDRREGGGALTAITALMGADRGVAVIVADLARRGGGLAGALAPERREVEVFDALDGRLDPEEISARLKRASGRPALLILDYAALAVGALPADLHLAVLDPPTDPFQDAALAGGAARRWLHLLWGDDEAQVAAAVARDEWDLRPTAAGIWRALGAAPAHRFGDELDALLLGSHGPVRPVRIVARALRALEEAGLITHDSERVRPLAVEGRVDLGATPTGRACADLLEGALARCADARTIRTPAAGNRVAGRGIVNS